MPCLINDDGNCLFRSISLSLYGSETYHEELRARCILEMLINFEKYVDSSIINSMLESPIGGEGNENPHHDLVTLLANMASSSFNTSNNKLVFLKEIVRVSKLNEWGTTWLFFAMANALNINIRQFYPNLKNNSSTSKILNGQIKPLLSNNKSEIYYKIEI